MSGALVADDPEPVTVLPSYTPFGSDDWTYEPCLNGDLLLESSWQRSDGLYWNTEVGQSPADVF